MYYKFSDYLKTRYGEKVYKIPVNLPVTCPNRDGNISSNGCIFCSDIGAGFECLPNSLEVKDQLQKNIKYIGKKYNAKKFIAYFQNYSNTYLPIEEFKNYVYQCLINDIVAIYISTRPDCILKEHLEFLKQIKERCNIDIIVELGLQTVNYHTLKVLNRGHSLAEFIHSVINIKRYDITVCAHYIVDLPMDNIEDVIEGAKIISALGVDQVKCHSLYVLKNTKLYDMYKNNEIKIVTIEEFIDRTICFLEYLNPEIVIQRLIGRAPESDTIFCNWGMSWWKIKEQIEEKMSKMESFQGRKYNYLQGKGFV